MTPLISLEQLPPLQQMKMRMVVSDSFTGLFVGKAVICIGDHYFETEEMREKLLPQVVSSEVTEGWARVLQSNPFSHMTES
jgi:hypothetical protein